MQHSTYQDTTSFPHHTIFHITHFAFQSRLKWQNSHRTTLHIKLTSNHISYRSNRSTASRLGTPFHTVPTFHAMHLSTFKYKFHIPLSHSTTHPTLHFNHHFTSPPCLIWRRQTIPHQSLGIPQPHFTSSQHTTIFHMYHTIVPHRITTFLI